MDRIEEIEILIDYLKNQVMDTKHYTSSLCITKII